MSNKYGLKILIFVLSGLQIQTTNTTNYSPTPKFILLFYSLTPKFIWSFYSLTPKFRCAQITKME